jgi:hypothetical protein
MRSACPCQEEETIFEARAPESGVVLYVRAVPSMTKGETIASIGVVRR